MKKKKRLNFVLKIADKDMAANDSL